MKLGTLLILAATLCCVTVAAFAQSPPAKSSTVTLGDKVIVIPNPEGFEETSSLERIKQVLARIQTPATDTLLVHMPVSDYERVKAGSRPGFRHYTKVSVPKSRREVPSSDEDMAAFVAALRKNRSVIFDPDGLLFKSVMENLSRQGSEASSKEVNYDVNANRYLGEFDVRPAVYSYLVLLLYTKDVDGSETKRAVVASMTMLKVGPRIINIGVYRNLSSPDAVQTELKPAAIEVKQFTTKWVNEILAAN